MVGPCSEYWVAGLKKKRTRGGGAFSGKCLLRGHHIRACSLGLKLRKEKTERKSLVIGKTNLIERARAKKKTIDEKGGD